MNYKFLEYGKYKKEQFYYLIVTHILQIILFYLICHITYRIYDRKELKTTHHTLFDAYFQ